MKRFFNTAGPCRPEKHYMLPVLARLPTVRALIDQEAYFVMHAPRQVGKTTSLLTLAKELTAEGRHTAVLVTAEEGSAFSDIGAAELAILQSWRRSAAGSCGRRTWSRRPGRRRRRAPGSAMRWRRGPGPRSARWWSSSTRSTRRGTTS